ncbi:class I adenylate-forming enzyme family protein [Nocardia africana]|uniref:Long-chain-fatty-acid--CoA ligase n=1 Tax=Nocardia africana TaxID=134964 RepID=A0A378WZC5_9NOCA|nr:AMP-binding protein [Nocardia africana]MCC3312909.1 AMP-binding protein [Nocardia africana]SUA45751.1 Long-chain-fatty-acid--CoA ligase [Nocardia africana]
MSEALPFAPEISPAEILPFAARRHRDKCALIVGEKRFTYIELDTMSRQVAAALQHRGIGAGDVVSLYGQNSWEWIVGYHGALRAGAVVNPINVMLTGPELTYVLNDCQSGAVFAGSAQTATAAAIMAETPSVKLFVEFGDAPQEPAATPFSALLREGTALLPTEVQHRPGDLCAIAYTSGTTGHPKGAMQSHQAILLNCALTATMHARSRDDIVVTALPAAHVYGNVAINSTFLVGGTVVLMERFDAAAALGLIARERATMFEGVPAMYSMILADDSLAAADLRSLRLTTVGGQTFSVDTLRKWQQRSGVPMIELWGMTELAGLGTTHSPYAPQVPGSIGVALPGVEIRIAALNSDSGDGDHQREAPVGEPGELQIRGPLVMLGYFGNPTATEEVVLPDGWMRTGDIAYSDETRHFFVVDRLKDMIVTAGYNVYPAEIERVIASHPDVAMVAVGRRPDDVRGEIAVAYVVAKAGAHLRDSDILDHCRSGLAAYKRPRAVEFVDQLPTTASGKIMRRKLGELTEELRNTP